MISIVFKQQENLHNSSSDYIKVLIRICTPGNITPTSKKLYKWKDVMKLKITFVGMTRESVYDSRLCANNNASYLSS